MHGLGWGVVLSVAVLLGACGGGARKKDAEDLIRALEAIPMFEPGQRLEIMAEACSELEACAPGECSRALHDAAGAMPEHRGVLLAKGCPEFARGADPGRPMEPQMIEFLEGKYRKLADDVRKGLDSDLKRKLDAALQGAGLL